MRVDNTAPTGTDVQTTNVSGGTAGRMDANDTIRLTYSEAMAPASIMSGWTGSSQGIRVTVADSGSADKLDFTTTTGTRLNLVNTLTDLNLAGDYVGSATVWTANMAMSGNTITVTLVSRSSGTLKTVATNTTMTWRPNAAALDLAGLAASTTLVTESGTADRDF